MRVPPAKLSSLGPQGGLARTSGWTLGTTLGVSVPVSEGGHWHS